MVAWVFFLVLFGGATVVSCLPHCFFNLQTSKLFVSGDKEPMEPSPSFGFPQSLLSDLQEAVSKSPSFMQFRDSFLGCLKGTLYTQAHISAQVLAVFWYSFGTSS